MIFLSLLVCPLFLAPTWDRMLWKIRFADLQMITKSTMSEPA